MGTQIEEPIRVGVVFERGLVSPRWFLWGGRRYNVSKVTMRWQTQEGQAPVLHLGVTDGVNLFELAFNQKTLTWKLASVEEDGCA